MISRDMKQVLVRIDDQLAQEVRRLVKEKYGGRRGALSLIVEDALRRLTTPTAEISASTLLEVIDYVSRASKADRPKEEILTNVFIMLDREFEQSIIRGVDEMKKGRVREVPKNREPIEFLRELAAKS